MRVMPVIDCAGQTVVVTGGTRGIGAGIARGFLAAGAQVLVYGRHEPGERADRAADREVPSAGGRSAEFARADVRDPERAQQLIQAAAERFGRVDVVISNAGGSPPAAAATASPGSTPRSSSST
jgi:NAD(P)-dependent dehydrogenase (short-subunit alcohol dehydrogenase family)